MGPELYIKIGKKIKEFNEARDLESRLPSLTALKHLRNDGSLPETEVGISQKQREAVIRFLEQNDFYANQLVWYASEKAKETGG